MRRHRWRAVLMSWLLLIILAVASAATMVGWAAVVASSFNHTMHALNGNGPGKGRPSIGLERLSVWWLRRSINVNGLAL